MSGKSLGNARRKLHPKAGSRPPLGAVQRASRLRGQAGVPVSGHPESGAQNANAVWGRVGVRSGRWRKAPSARTPVVASLARAPRRRPGDPDLGADTQGKTAPVCGAGCPGITSSPRPCTPARLSGLPSLTLTAGSPRWGAAGGSASPRGIPAEAASGGSRGARAAPAALRPRGRPGPRPLHPRGPGARSASQLGEQLPAARRAESRGSAGKWPRLSGSGAGPGAPPSRRALLPAALAPGRPGRRLRVRARSAPSRAGRRSRRCGLTEARARAAR